MYSGLYLSASVTGDGVVGVMVKVAGVVGVMVEVAGVMEVVAALVGRGDIDVTVGFATGSAVLDSSEMGSEFWVVWMSSSMRVTLSSSSSFRSFVSNMRCAHSAMKDKSALIAVLFVLHGVNFG